MVQVGKAVALIVIAMLMGASQPGDVNSSETGATTKNSRTETPISRESRGQQYETDTVRVRGEAEHYFVDYSSYDLMAFMRMDMDTSSTARMMVDMVDSDYFLDSLDGYEIEGTFRVRDAGDCKGMYGHLDWQEIYIVACADGRYVNLIMATDKQVAIDTAQSVYEDGVIVIPEGYVEEDL